MNDEIDDSHYQVLFGLAAQVIASATAERERAERTRLHNQRLTRRETRGRGRHHRNNGFPPDGNGEDFLADDEEEDKNGLNENFIATYLCKYLSVESLKTSRLVSRTWNHGTSQRLRRRTRLRIVIQDGALQQSPEHLWSLKDFQDWNVFLIIQKSDPPQQNSYNVARREGFLNEESRAFLLEFLIDFRSLNLVIHDIDEPEHLHLFNDILNVVAPTLECLELSFTIHSVTSPFFINTALPLVRKLVLDPPRFKVVPPVEEGKECLLRFGHVLLNAMPNLTSLIASVDGFQGIFGSPLHPALRGVNDLTLTGTTPDLTTGVANHLYMLLNLTYPLTHLTLGSGCFYLNPCACGEAFYSLAKMHASTLKVLDMYITVGQGPVPHVPQMMLPVLPELTSLTLRFYPKDNFRLLFQHVIPPGQRPWHTRAHTDVIYWYHLPKLISLRLINPLEATLTPGIIHTLREGHIFDSLFPDVDTLPPQVCHTVRFVEVFPVELPVPFPSVQSTAWSVLKYSCLPVLFPNANNPFMNTISRMLREYGWF